MTDFAYADAGSLRGQLQRGRGVAARRAPAQPAAGDLVYECVVTDTRWDPQIEQRDSYLARLMHRLNLPVAPIERELFSQGGQDAEEIDTALRVLALLAFMGRDDAPIVLTRYAVEGPHWPSALEAIEQTGARKIAGIWDGLAETVVAAHDDAELAAQIYGAWEPWVSFARTQPRIRRILDDLSARRPAAPTAPAVSDSSLDMSAAELIKRVLTTDARNRSRALQELGKRGELAVLDLAEDPVVRNAAGRIFGMPQALHHLGSTAVARARRWTDSGDSTLEALAVGVLSDFGDRADGPWLLSALTTAAEQGAWCATETPARGLGRLRMREATDTLVQVWQDTVHSLARQAILQGLRGCTPDLAHGYIVEGLDDCEPDVQQAACAAAPDTVITRARLRELHDDPLAPEAHEAAAQRLAQLADAAESG